MQFTLNGRYPRIHFLLAAPFVLATLCAGMPSARAGDSAYIQQIGGGGSVTVNLNNNTLPVKIVSAPSIGAPISYRPNAQTLSTSQTARNLATTLEVGSYNNVAQVQNGKNDVSNVGIWGGTHNNVGVWQTGDNLTSNLMLMNTVGLPVAVIQRPGSSPVNMFIAQLPNNMLIATLPGGGLLIRR